MNTTINEELIFALDIGTRSVIGIAGYKKNDVFNLICVEKEEYKSRVVIDGQIDDIAQTAETANIVKERMEKALGQKLTNVYIAAAGRSLRTVEVAAEMPVETSLIEENFMKRLEFSAVEKAIEEIAKTEDRRYYYVGHTVQKYILDDYEMASLVDHTGENAQVFMIATFLPEEVVKSLFTTMKRIGLTISGVTLEPIAAMNAIIPNEIRKLNLALCDIGAGTSDIAICSSGSVTGYTMATIAGDEITEAIMQACLVDFNEAENIKSQFLTNEQIVFTNVLGLGQVMHANAISERISDVVSKLANVIGRYILELNGKAPAAVFLVGGGSQTPLLKPFVAKALGIDEDRVAIGGNIYMKKMVETDLDVFTPEFATPLGIAITAVNQSSTNTFSVKVNDENIHLFNIWDTSVLGILQISGHRYNQIMGKNGKQLTYTINGQSKVVRGGIPTSAEIILNDENASLSDIVTPGSSIYFRPSEDGEDAKIKLCDIIGEGTGFYVTVNGKSILAGNIARINGENIVENVDISNNDDIENEKILTIEELFSIIDDMPEEFDFIVNNGKKQAGYLLQENDVIQIFQKKSAPRRGATIIESDNRVKRETISLPEIEPIPVSTEEIKPQNTHIQINNDENKFPPIKTIKKLTDEDDVEDEIVQIKETEPKLITVRVNGVDRSLEPRPSNNPYMFFDLLCFTDIDPKNPKGDIVLLLNGKIATSYLEPINDRDVVEIYWNIKD